MIAHLWLISSQPTLQNIIKHERLIRSGSMMKGRIVNHMFSLQASRYLRFCRTIFYKRKLSNRWSLCHKKIANANIEHVQLSCWKGTFDGTNDRYYVGVTEHKYIIQAVEEVVLSCDTRVRSRWKRVLLLVRTSCSACSFLWLTLLNRNLSFWAF